jgi:hypothetical protein
MLRTKTTFTIMTVNTINENVIKIVVLIRHEQLQPLHSTAKENFLN